MFFKWFKLQEFLSCVIKNCHIFDSDGARSNTPRPQEQDHTQWDDRQNLCIPTHFVILFWFLLVWFICIVYIGGSVCWLNTNMQSNWFCRWQGPIMSSSFSKGKTRHGNNKKNVWDNTFSYKNISAKLPRTFIHNTQCSHQVSHKMESNSEICEAEMCSAVLCSSMDTPIREQEAQQRTNQKKVVNAKGLRLPYGREKRDW